MNQGHLVGRRARRLGALLGVFSLVLLLAAGLEPDNTINVAAGEVSVHDNNRCSLIEAIRNANNTENGLVYDDCAAGNPGGADTIILPAGSSFQLTEVFGTGEYGPHGLPWVGSAVTIQGNGAMIWRNDSYAGFRVFSVGPLGNLTLNKLVVTGGRSSFDGDGIFNQGSLTVRDSRIYNNFGDGIYSTGELGRDASLTVINSTVNDNASLGVWTRFGVAQIVNSTLSDNEGGGLLNGRDGRTTITNSTLTGNAAANGGGVNNFEGITTLQRALISGNRADGAGDEVYNAGGVVNGGNSNVLGHAGAWSADAFSGFAPSGSDFNAAADAWSIALGNLLNTTLADNGGPTLTHALPLGSPAIDRAPSAACTAAPVNGVDQRGQARNADGDGLGSADECDAGAFERQGGLPPATNTPTPTATRRPTNTPTPTATATIRATVTPTRPADLDAALYLPMLAHVPELYFEGPFEVEPNNNWQTESNGPLRFGRAYQGRPNDIRDMYFVRVSQPGRLVADVTGHQGGGPRLGFYTVQSGVLRRLAQVDQLPLHLEWDIAQAGLVYIEVSTAHSFSEQPYTLVVHLQ